MNCYFYILCIYTIHDYFFLHGKANVTACSIVGDPDCYAALILILFIYQASAQRNRANVLMRFSAMQMVFPVEYTERVN